MSDQQWKSVKDAVQQFIEVLQRQYRLHGVVAQVAPLVAFQNQRRTLLAWPTGGLTKCSACPCRGVARTRAAREKQGSAVRFHLFLPRTLRERGSAFNEGITSMSRKRTSRSDEIMPDELERKPWSLEEARRRLAESLAKMIVRDHRNRLAAELSPRTRTSKDQE
jgi:hypothetical protein